MPSALGDQTLKLALVQYPFQAGRPVSGPNGLLEFVENAVVQAQTGGASLVVLPELLTMESLNTNPAASNKKIREFANDFTPEYFSTIRKLSQKYNISILSGSSPRLVKTENGKAENVVNTSLLAFPDGKEVSQDKLYLTPDETGYKWQEGQELKVFQAPWGKTVILICYDSEFPEISQLLVKEKPELILVPSMTADIYGFNRVRWSAQARAVEHFAYIAHTGTVSSGAVIDGWSNYGRASILTPQYKDFPGVLIEGPENAPALIFGTLNFETLRRVRKRAGLYPARDQEIRKYRIVLKHHTDLSR